MVNTTTWTPAATKLPLGSRLKAYAGSSPIEGFAWWAALPCLKTDRYRPMTSSFIKDHSLAIASSFMTTVRTYQDNGPYFGATTMSYQAASVSDILRHVRLAMEDREDTIAIFDAEGSCRGLWQRELEGHVDSAGDTIVDHDGYELRRPGGRSPKTFAMAVARLQRAA